jgi:hypothetical protein
MSTMHVQMELLFNDSQVEPISFEQISRNGIKMFHTCTFTRKADREDVFYDSTKIKKNRFVGKNYPKKFLALYVFIAWNNKS